MTPILFAELKNRGQKLHCDPQQKPQQQPRADRYIAGLARYPNLVPAKSSPSLTSRSSGCDVVTRCVHQALS